MTDEIRVIAGECTTTFEGTREREQRGRVVVLVKPDKTVLIHDVDGYQPAAWLTRPESLVGERDPPAVRAADGDQRLRVEVHEEYGTGRYPASTAGIPVGGCPACEGALVRAGGAVTCVSCGAGHGLPAGATVLGEPCGDCGLPLVRVARGEPFEVCVDRGCEPLLARVWEAFDRAWDCPDCGGDLRVLRRGGLLAGCERYPDCEVGFGIPDGVVDGTCDCGLPVFETGNGRRCLDATCAEG